NGHEPLRHWERRVLENRADAGAKLFLAAFAFPDLPCRDVAILAALTERTEDVSVRPAHHHGEGMRNFFVGEVDDGLLKGVRPVGSVVAFHVLFLTHADNIGSKVGCVKYVNAEVSRL